MRNEYYVALFDHSYVRSFSQGLDLHAIWRSVGACLELWTGLASHMFRMRHAWRGSVPAPPRHAAWAFQHLPKYFELPSCTIYYTHSSKYSQATTQVVLQLVPVSGVSLSVRRRQLKANSSPSTRSPGVHTRTASDHNLVRFSFQLLNGVARGTTHREQVAHRPIRDLDHGSRRPRVLSRHEIWGSCAFE